MSGRIARAALAPLLLFQFVFVRAEVLGQTIGLPGQTAAQNTGGGAVRGRNPGRMVQNGVVRHLDFSDRQAAGTMISEPELPDRFPGLVALALDTVFGQLNDAIVAFRSLLLLRAGRNPVTSSGTGSNSSENQGSSTSGGGASGGGRR